MKLVAPKPKAPTVTRYDLPADVAAEIQRARDAGSAKSEQHKNRLLAEAGKQLEEINKQLQGQVDAVISSLCSIEANRLKIPLGTEGQAIWKLTDDCKALEVPVQPKGEAKK